MVYSGHYISTFFTFRFRYNSFGLGQSAKDLHAVLGFILYKTRDSSPDLNIGDNAETQTHGSRVLRVQFCSFLCSFLTWDHKVRSGSHESEFTSGEYVQSFLKIA